MAQVLRYFHLNPKATTDSSSLTQTINLISLSVTNNTRAIEDKQTSIPGKSLSSNDFTNDYRYKLDKIEDRAEVNVQADWDENDSTADSYINNKPTALPASDVYDWAKQPNKPSYTLDEVPDGSSRKLSDYIPVSQRGVYGGVATLGANDGKVPESLLPSYVDDVLEFSSNSDFPITGESGKIYVNTTTNLTYRWTGTQYTEISPSIALGETSSTAYAGDKGKALKDAFDAHVADTVSHITAAERAVWNAKQDAISDLATIRSNASTAYGWGDHSQAGYLMLITDLATIRSNASNGAIAYNWGDHANAGYLTGITKTMVTNALGYTPPTSDTNTTYTIATGDSNGLIKVTPSSGSAYNVSVKGLGSAAYLTADTAASASTVVQRDANKYIYGTYFNSNIGDENINSYTNNPAIMFTSNDKWIRRTTKADLLTWLGLGSRAYDSTSYLPLAGGTMTGALTVRQYIFGYNYNHAGNNAPAFVFDKPGSNYTGIGAHSTSDTIYFGAATLSNGEASWVDSYKLKWLFNGTVTADNFYGDITGNLTGNADTATNADKIDSLHASDLVKFYLSPMPSGATADSAKSWFTGTMPNSSGAIVYNVPGSEKTIIAGKSSGSYGHMLMLGYDDAYLRILRYKAGSWKSTNWEKIYAGYADSAGNADTLDGKHASAFSLDGHTHSYLPLSGGTLTGDLIIGGATLGVYTDTTGFKVYTSSNDGGGPALLLDPSITSPSTIGQGSDYLTISCGKTGSRIKYPSGYSLWIQAHGQTAKCYFDPFGEFYASSDMSLKDNIYKLDDQERHNIFEWAIREGFKKFTWKDDQRNGFGVIAQDVLEILPDTVNYDKGLKLYGVDYNKLHSYVIDAVVHELKDCKEEIKLLQALIAELKLLLNK